MAQTIVILVKMAKKIATIAPMDARSVIIKDGLPVPTVMDRVMKHAHPVTVQDRLPVHTVMDRVMKRVVDAVEQVKTNSLISCLTLRPTPVLPDNISYLL